MRIIIVGAGEVGSHLAKMLSHESNDITVIDEDNGRLTRLLGVADVVTVHGDPTSISILEEAGAASADLLVAVCPPVRQYRQRPPGQEAGNRQGNRPGR